jgi:hypothetical protein
MNDIDVFEKLSPTALTRADSISTLESFMDPVSVIESLSNKGITPSWIMERLIEVAENSDREATRLSAIREIRKIINEIAERSGLVTKITQTQTMDDGSVLSAERVANVLSGIHQVPSQIPRVKNPKTGKFISRKEKEKQIMAEATAPPQAPVGWDPRETVAPHLTQQDIDELENQQMEMDFMETKGESLKQFEKAQEIQPKIKAPTEREIQEEKQYLKELKEAYNGRAVKPEQPAEVPYDVRMEEQKEEQLGKPKILKFPNPPQGPKGKIPAQTLRPQKEPQTQTTDPGTSTSTSPRPPETNVSSQASHDPPPPSPVDPQFTKLAEHVLVNVDENYILAHMGSILSNPTVVPPLNIWTPDVPINVPKLVRSLINQPGYLQQIYPILKVLMGTSFSNIEWTSNVLVTLAFYDMVKVLPFAQHLPGAKQ